MILDSGICTVYQKVNIAPAGAMPVFADQQIHCSSYGELSFETTPARVERAIRNLIEVTWTRGDIDVLDQYFGNTISASRGKPTNGEFIARIANVVKARMREVQ